MQVKFSHATQKEKKNQLRSGSESTSCRYPEVVNCFLYFIIEIESQTCRVCIGETRRASHF